ncbi:IPT/TIG domain-containing protein [Bacteroides sp. 51]|uniref:IPT/TIG domain-containing protein n=1 Tax=Bacteroides sp. 51 TaxID=2302938 RepID=UPI0013D63533|nr:IPT/TIG domain-containing protein [Bacteroides sp. 51]NDV82828.1 hypothetical protein [Bacteroides sp. 51]
MRKRNLKRNSWQALTLLICMATVFFVSCDGSETVEPPKMPEVPYNPAQPVVIKDFQPKEGGVRTQVLIEGSNFGTDLSLINVYLDDVRLNVISSSGTLMYVSIPQATPSTLETPITVQIGKEANKQEVKTTEEFKYVIEPYVSTLAGFLDNRNNSPAKDGLIMLPGDPDFDENLAAQFDQPMWLTFDQDQNLYLLEEEKGLRFIDKDHTSVVTKHDNAGMRLRTIAFANDFQSMLIATDRGSWDDYAAVRLTAARGFTDWERAINGKQCNGGAYHPQDNIYFFNSFEDGIVFKWSGSSNPLDARQNSKQLFKIQDRDWEFNIQFHPSGDFAYIVVINQHYILKSYYNRATQELEAPVIFAGYPRSAGHNDGVATAARFDRPYQGAFDEEGNFYVCDAENHCIRKITPNGIVSTFAGRARNSGYADGPVSDAQFHRPNGIAYDSENKIFYVADRDNKRIRMINMPK